MELILVGNSFKLSSVPGIQLTKDGFLQVRVICLKNYNGSAIQLVKDACSFIGDLFGKRITLDEPKTIVVNETGSCGNYSIYYLDFKCKLLHI